jgi:hypothetical protein
MANPVENIITHPPTSPLEKTIIYPSTSPTAEIMDPEDIKLLQAIKAMGIKLAIYTIKVNITNKLKKSKYKI